VKKVECVREHEVVRAVLAQQWPQHVDAELRAHVGVCPICGSVALVSLFFARERDQAIHDHEIPAAGQVWWRSALRAHAEAAHAARRPLIWQLGIAGACATGFGAALIDIAWPSIREAAARTAAVIGDLANQMPSIDLAAIGPLIERIQPALHVGVAVLACVELTPIVVNYALSDD
jgi:hypothetical protein